MTTPMRNYEEENSALKQFVRTLGFSPDKVISQMANHENDVCKTIALSSLQIKLDFTDSKNSLTDKGQQEAARWLESLR
jgi:hypothetical protein